MSVDIHQERGLLSGRRVTQRPPRTQSVRHEVLLAAPPEKVFDFCLTPEGYSAIMPTRITMKGQTDEEIGQGSSVAWNFWLMNVIPVRWVAHIAEHDRPRQFVDLQLRGLFTYFRHTHSCEPHGTGTLYRDEVEFASRMGAFVDRTAVRAELNRNFRHRQRRMREILGAGGA
ncbi:SRPBCC family protein [Streptomyces bohaiensis]|uniref:Polyketide cyclase/dehydrase n=1 Tax=Streptomyces bohaiensis TaxID=1431344 RepID=A0ABX1C880_9ACTN|nr:SRPBCC family protein [Streptomyces bohaiensis]NJQ14441.1 polyketide cyclase/dehydrase [Streptomyces bohaiensis]